jgi:hypothetical protein
MVRTERARPTNTWVKKQRGSRGPVNQLLEEKARAPYYRERSGAPLLIRLVRGWGVRRWRHSRVVSMLETALGQSLNRDRCGRCLQDLWL